MDVSDKTRWFSLVALGIFFLTAVIRLPVLLHPFPVDDEQTYSLVANAVVDGGRVYAEAVERKPPLLFWTYAAVFKVAGEYNWEALHLIALVWILGTMAGLYLIGSRLVNPFTGFLAALLYSIFQPWGTFTNLAFNGEVLMNLPLVWAYALAFGQSRSRLRPELLAAGGLLAAGFLLKQPAAIAAIPLGIYLLLPSYQISRGLRPIDSIIQAALLTAGFFGALGLAAFLLWRQGTLTEAYYWIFTNNEVPLVFWTKGILMTLVFAAACLPLLIGAAVRHRDNNPWTRKEAERIALVGWIVASAVGVAAGGRFYPHYYIQLIPPLAVLAAVNYGTLWSGKSQIPHWWYRPTTMSVWLSVIAIGFFVAHWQGLSQNRKPTASGRYLLQHSNPNDRIFVWGQAPKIYLDAHRRPASRFVLTFPLTGYIYGGLTNVDTRDRIVPGAWTKLEQDFDRHPPAFIVDVQVPQKNAQYPIRNFPYLANLLAKKYRLATAIPGGVIYTMR